MDSDEVRHEWAERSGEYSPAYYAYYGPDETSEAVREMLDRFVGRDARVLELGCSSGRHLSHLFEHGYDRLAGIEINDEAFEVMGDAYPDLADSGTFHHAAIEDVVGEFDDGEFEAVYSVETLQHIHPGADWVFGELARITDDLLVTAEIETERSSGGGEAGDAESRTDHPSEDGSATDEHSGADVNYVTEDVPLYYRDWGQVFGALGLDEVATRDLDRDTVRAFRAPDQHDGR